ncbi:hypothetical protein [Roseivivax sp. THAF197b]|uniref:hypothetical protein n=1 Tax=Roseivivax sp. THAF197b TaxID=2588299 RepID=UPI001267B18B|nr:hypothetical protein [Roseivivax sp. THAF197b]QFS85053.1 hypothetical protein FIV09_19580 [Roseivivax sp. THAF197b]
MTALDNMCIATTGSLRAKADNRVVLIRIDEPLKITNAIFSSGRGLRVATPSEAGTDLGLVHG